MRKGPGPRTIDEIAALSADRFSDRTAMRRLSCENSYSETTFATLERRVAMAASNLKSKGFLPGRRAAIIGTNSPEWVVGALAILRAGGILVPIDSNSKRHETTHILKASGTDTILSSPDCLPEETAPARTVMLLGEKPEQALSALEDIDPALEPVKTCTERERDDTALIVYTSGTTGVAKGVMLSHDNILHNVEACCERIEFGAKDSLLSILPLSHMFEFTAGFLCPLSSGSSVTFIRSLQGREILLNLKLSATNIIIGVPRIFQLLKNTITRRMSKLPSWKQFLLKVLHPLARRSTAFAALLYRDVHNSLGGGLRFCIVGGAPVSPELVHFWNELGIPLLQGYGLTETSPVVSVCTPDDNRPGTAGRPLKDIELRIEADGLRAGDIDDRPVGEILIRGPSVMQGYYRDEKASSSVLDSGWFRTGDLGYIVDGFLFVRGRSKALIVTASGKNIYPEELETVIGQSPYIREICVVVTNRGEQGERPFALVVPDTEAFKLETGVKPDNGTYKLVLDREIRRLNHKLSRFKRLAGWRLQLEALPKTPTQKIKRKEVQKLFDSERGRPVTDQHQFTLV